VNATTTVVGCDSLEDFIFDIPQAYYFWAIQADDVRSPLSARVEGLNSAVVENSWQYFNYTSNPAPGFAQFVNYTITCFSPFVAPPSPTVPVDFLLTRSPTPVSDVSSSPRDISDAALFGVVMGSLAVPLLIGGVGIFVYLKLRNPGEVQNIAHPDPVRESIAQRMKRGMSRASSSLVRTFSKRPAAYSVREPPV